MQLVECLPYMREIFDPQHHIKLGVVRMYKTPEVEAGGSIQGHPPTE